MSCTGVDQRFDGIETDVPCGRSVYSLNGWSVMGQGTMHLSLLICLLGKPGSKLKPDRMTRDWMKLNWTFA
jgi:hypothetical protein